MQSETNWVYEPWEHEAIKILKEVHPNKWDMQHRDHETDIIILFPEIIIVNSLGQSHKIIDLYLKLTFRTETGVLHSACGNRGKISQAEKQSNYSHSHLSSGVIINHKWGSFCFGGGPIKKQYHSLVDKFDSLQFELFLHAFQIYIEWESIEGGPYNYIADIKRKMNIQNIPFCVQNDTYIKFINKCKKLEFIINNNYVSVDHNDPEFIDQITPLLKKEYLVNKTVNGDFYTEGLDNEYSPTDLYFKFKNEQVFQIVYENKSAINGKKYPHPEISKYIAKKLSRNLSLYTLFKRRKLKRNTKGHFIGGVMVQDCQTTSNIG